MGYYRPCKEFDECDRLIEEYFKTKQYEKCFQGHLALAEAGYPLAECQIGYFYYEGLGVEKDLSQAFAWTKRAAEHGDRDAQCNLAEFYEEGIGTTPDLEQAKYWYQRSAKQDHELALKRCRELSIMINEQKGRSHASRRSSRRAAGRFSDRGISMDIRTADVGDVPVLAEHDRRISRQELERSVRMGRVYVAEEQGEFIGWLRYSLFWGDIPFMDLLYVLDGRRGQGRGRLLVGWWEDQMERAGHETVMTSTQSNEYAQHFYDRLGYAAVGGFLLPGEPYELIFAKKL